MVVAPIRYITLLNKKEVIKIITVPNQKVIKIIENDKHNEKPYAIITETEQVWAARLLNDKSAAHILYYYFAFNQDGYKFALSPTAIKNRYGITAKQYRKGIEKLQEVGYLTQKANDSNVWLFNRIPEKYIHTALSEWTIPSTLCTQEDIPCTPKGIDGIPQKVHTVCTQGDREIIQYNTLNSTNNILSDLELQCIRNDLISSIENDYGHTDECIDELIKVQAKAERNGYKIEKHIDLLKDLLVKLSDKLNFRKSQAKARYDNAIQQTLPTDAIEQTKVKLIIEKYLSTHKIMLPKDYGFWINGWNEEEQEPNIIISLFAQPYDVILKQKHNIEGIPKEYYIKKKEC